MKSKAVESDNPGEFDRGGRYAHARPRHRRIWSVAALLLMVLVVAGCSGDRQEPAAPQESPSAPPDGAAGQNKAERDQDAPGADAEDIGSGVPDDSNSNQPNEKPTPGGPRSPAPAPGDGDVHTEVDVEEQEFLPPADLRTKTEVGDVASIALLDIVRADVEARAAGEISGPGVIVSIRLTNDSDGELDLGWVTVNAEDADDMPLVPMGGPPADPFFGPLAIGSSAEATYVFGLPEEVSTPITVTVNPVPDVAVAVFTGDPS